MHKSVVTAAIAAAIGLSGVAANAAIVLSDNFDSYAAGNLVGQGGWQQTGTTSTSPIQVGTVGSGEGAFLGTTGQDAYEPLTAAIPHTTGNVMDMSMTINVSAAQSTGDYFAHLSDPAGSTTTFLARLGIKSSGAGYVLGLEPTAGGGGAFTYGTTVYPFNANESVDVTWNFLAGTTSDTFTVSVGGTPSAGLSSIPWGSTIAEPSQVSSFNLRQGTSTQAPTLTVDNVVVTGTPAVPEPASIGAVFGVGCLLLGRRSRRRLAAV